MGGSRCGGSAASATGPTARSRCRSGPPTAAAATGWRRRTTRSRRPPGPRSPRSTGSSPGSFRPVGTGGDWVERDAAVVWHGFTQMSCYADNAPIVVERAEGRELIDVDGRRYLDAISSLWVTTLGHHVSELDAALTSQLERVAHTTMLGNGNRAAVEFAEALAAVVPVESPHMLFASDGAAAVEHALKIAFQFWVNRGETGRSAYLALGGAYHGDTVGS